MREYGKVYSSFWTSEDIRGMSEDGRTLALYLMTSPHGNMLGCFRMPNAYAAEDLQWPSERVSNGFAELSRNGFVTRCERTYWIVIHKHLKWNKLDNPNMGTAAAKLFDTITAPHSVKALLVQAIRAFGKNFPLKKLAEIANEFEGILNHTETVPEGSQYGTETVSKQVAVAVAVTGTGTGTVEESTDPDGSVVPSAAGDEKDESAKNGSKPDCPHQEIIALYHEVLPMCPQVRDWTTTRATQLRTRWNEDPKRQNLTYWRQYFEYVKSCGFLVGRGAGERPFLADLEWLTKSQNFTKVREGKYE
jgi:hypothetical protein